VHWSRNLVAASSREGAPPVAALKKPERQTALYPSAMFDYQSAEVQRWIKPNKLNRSKSESDIDFARRVFSTISNKYEHGYQAEKTIIWNADPKKGIPFDQWRASLVAAQKKSHSAGSAVLFVSVLRANNIPSRILVGQWAD